MKYKLIKPITERTALTQVLSNRGIPKDNILKYIQATLNDINPPEAFGEEKLRAAASMLLKHIKNNDKTVIIIDPNVDGNTASAVLINFLYQAIAPQWVKDKESMQISSQYSVYIKNYVCNKDIVGAMFGMDENFKHFGEVTEFTAVISQPSSVLFKFLKALSIINLYYHMPCVYLTYFLAQK